MSLAELVITSVVVEGRTKSEVARDYGVSRYWVHQLVRRYQAEGEAAFQARSRRPHTSPQAVGPQIEDRIIRVRKQLSRHGLDAGAETIRFHLQRDRSVDRVPAVSPLWRFLPRRGFVTPQPQKRPRSSLIRFEADQPNERWQADITHWHLADGTDVEICDIVDDHSRLAVAAHALRVFKAADVVDVFDTAFTRWGLPASVLTDNGAVFTANPRGTRTIGDDRSRMIRRLQRTVTVMPCRGLGRVGSSPPASIGSLRRPLDGAVA